MIKKLLNVSLCGLTSITLLTSCSMTRPAASASAPVTAPKATPSRTSRPESGKELRFLNQISTEPKTNTTSVQTIHSTSGRESSTAAPSDISLYMNRSTNLEQASSLQFKYAVLLDTEVEQLDNVALLENVDEWYGTRYQMGGTSKSGVDCSAFVQSVCLATYASNLPRTAREQYRVCDKISSVEMKEGDLVFFNTTGGVSHVGIYLRNNKFAHASSSHGVTVSDMFDPYYLKRFIGAGRFAKTETTVR